MNITKESYDNLLNIECVPPERGGILGGNNDIINIACNDTGDCNDSRGNYIPNTRFLNTVIANWCDQNIDFCGIFHTHAHNWVGLSESDIKYIEDVMRSMPKDVVKLYFPIIYPHEYIMPFIALRNGNEIHIQEEKLNIIN